MQLGLWTWRVITAGFVVRCGRETRIDDEVGVRCFATEPMARAAKRVERLRDPLRSDSKAASTFRSTWRWNRCLRVLGVEQILLSVPLVHLSYPLPHLTPPYCRHLVQLQGHPGHILTHVHRTDEATSNRGSQPQIQVYSLMRRSGLGFTCAFSTCGLRPLPSLSLVTDTVSSLQTESRRYRHSRRRRDCRGSGTSSGYRSQLQDPECNCKSRPVTAGYFSVTAVSL
jgi:hypothetical protein